MSFDDSCMSQSPFTAKRIAWHVGQMPKSLALTALWAKNVKTAAAHKSNFWCSPDTLLMPIAQAIAELIWSGDFGIVRACERPRKTLLYQTPADKFAECVAAIG
jgi:hypothetical protein